MTARAISTMLLFAYPGVIGEVLENTGYLKGLGPPFFIPFQEQHNQ